MCGVGGWGGGRGCRGEGGNQKMGLPGKYRVAKLSKIWLLLQLL